MGKQTTTYSGYRPTMHQNRTYETDFEFAYNLEHKIHQQALQGKIASFKIPNPALKKLTTEEQEICLSVHQGCDCRAV